MSDTPTRVKRRDEGRLFKSLQSRFRGARFAKIQALIEHILTAQDELRILDLGGRAEYWNMLRPDLRKRVHIVLLNYGEELSAYSKNVVDSLSFENRVGNACAMPEFDSASFDLVHSNSVIEHVGSYSNMLDFAAEVRRVGKAYYVQTPNFWFPIDPHSAFPLLHWLPDPIRIFAITRFNIGVTKRVDFGGAAGRLDGTKMISRSFFRSLFPDAAHSSERLGLIFVKSLIAIRGAP
jgi:Methyltransferase domain